MSKDKIDFNYLNKKLIELIEILRNENIMLSKFQIEKIQSKQTEKMNILKSIEFYREEIVKNKNIYKDSDLFLKTIENLKSVDDLSAKNLFLIEKALIINEKIINIIVSEIKENTKIIYNSKGQKKSNDLAGPLSSESLV